MPIVEQRVTPTELYVRGLANEEITLTKAQVQAFYQTTNGNAASRRAQTIQWVKDQIVAAMPQSIGDPTRITFTVNGTTLDIEELTTIEVV